MLEEAKLSSNSQEKKDKVKLEKNEHNIVLLNHLFALLSC